MAIQRLSREDRFMLWPDRRWPQVNGALLLLGPDQRLDVTRLRTVIASRLDAVPRFRQVLWVPPRRLGGPLWIDAQAFDIAQHVSAVSVAAPAGEPELLATVEELWCRPLDRSRPLWELWLLGDLPEGRRAVFVKLHHAMADGVAAIATLAAFLDVEASASMSAPKPWRPDPRPSDRELLIDSLHGRAASVRRGLARAAHPVRTARSLGEAWPATKEIFAEQPVPPTSLGGVVGFGHNLAPARTSLELMKEVAHARGATVNDVFLELIAAGLRELLATRGELRPGMVVRVSVPVSLRLADRARARGNLISQMIVPLPVGDADSLSRLTAIAAETARRKQLRRPSMAVFPVNRVIGPLLLKAVARQRVNVASTNVPGPDQRLYLAGAEIEEVFPLLPLIGNEPLAVGAMSYAGRFNLMAVGDRRLVPDLDVFAAAVRSEAEHLGVATPRAEEPAKAPAMSER